MEPRDTLPYVICGIVLRLLRGMLCRAALHCVRDAWPACRSSLPYEPRLTASCDVLRFPLLYELACFAAYRLMLLAACCRAPRTACCLMLLATQAAICFEALQHVVEPRDTSHHAA